MQGRITPPKIYRNPQRGSHTTHSSHLHFIFDCYTGNTAKGKSAYTVNKQVFICLQYAFYSSSEVTHILSLNTSV